MQIIIKIKNLKTQSKPLILVTNDDGVNSRGLNALIEVVKPFGRIVVVASEDSKSGMSHAITFKVPLRISKIKEDEDIEIYKCSGTPVDCVKLALNQILDKKPDFLVSGINHGSNSSVSIFYSGTMGSVIEGCLNGIPSIGFSITDRSHDIDLTMAEKYAKKIVENVVLNGLPDGICLNVNFPAISIAQVKGVKICRQTKGVWKEEYDKRVDPHDRDYYWLTGNFNNYESDAEDTDEWALKNNYVSIVPVQIDLTSYSAIESLRKWDFNVF